MHTARSHGRGRVVAAIVVSLSLHGLVGLCWLNGIGIPTAEGTSIVSTVDAPEDREVAFVLREPRSVPPPKVNTPSVQTEPPVPAVLPPTLVRPPSTTNAGAITPIGASPQPPSDLPKFGGAKPLHGRPMAGTTVVYVLDRSASMGPNGLLGRAANAVRASLTELGPDARFQIVVYNGAATMFAVEPKPATPEATESANQWLHGLTAEGRSEHLAGIRQALAVRPTEVFLLTDADDLDDREVRHIATMVRPPVRLTAAVFGSSRSASVTPLERLTTRLGGSVRYIDR